MTCAFSNSRNHGSLTYAFIPDVTDPDKLQQIKTITRKYMSEPEQQERLEILSDILKGGSGNRFRKWFRR